MIRPTLRALRRLALVTTAAAVAAHHALAQEPELDPVALEDLVAPVALYPDDVLGIILPASTFPLDVVNAARFLEALENDPTLEPDEDWDDSIIALLNYPEVLQMMNEDLDWTWALGEAVLTDQAAVLAAAQNFREQAYAAGNLQSDDKQVVTRNERVIVIEPADPEVIYIPVYEPYEVIVYQPRPIISYYPVAYPVYYYPYPYGYSFGINYFWGVTSWFSIGWHSHYVHVHHHTHHAHPYYQNSYYSYTNYYPRNSVHVTVDVDNYTNVWTQGTRRGGSRPRTITTESRTSAVRTNRTATVETQPGLGNTRRSTTGAPETTFRSPATSSQRAPTARAIESPPVTSSTRSVRSNAPATSNGSSFSAPETRQEAAPTTRSQTRTVTQPTTTRSTRSVTTTPGSTRRVQSVAPGISTPPVQSQAPTSTFAPPASFSPPPSSPAPSVSTPAPSTRSGQSASPAPRQAPSNLGSGTRTRQP